MIRLHRQFFAYMSEEGGADGGSEGGTPSNETTGTTPITIGIDNHEYVDKPWFGDLLKNEEPGVALLKQHDNLLTKLGQGAPKPPESMEDETVWNEFVATLRPDETSAYELNPYEMPADDSDEAKYKSVYEHLNAGLTDDYKGFIQDTFHKAGLMKPQADFLVKSINDYALKQTKAEFDAQQEALNQYHEEFNVLAIKELGADKETVLEQAKGLIDKYVPESVSKYNKTLDNEALLQLAMNINHIARAYGMEDKGKVKGGTAPAAQTLSDVNAEYKKFFSDNQAALTDFTHPKHDWAVKQEAKFSEQFKRLT